MRETTTDDLADEWADRQPSQACKCAGDMPGRCPGPASCPMCESEALDADEALNCGKVERADVKAARDDAMMRHLLREVA